MPDVEQDSLVLRHERYHAVHKEPGGLVYAPTGPEPHPPNVEPRPERRTDTPQRVAERPTFALVPR
jgi:hypothetical protein